MAFHILEPGDEEILEECPVCGEGYLVPTTGNWLQCSECGVEVEEDEYGSLNWDIDVVFKN